MLLSTNGIKIMLRRRAAHVSWANTADRQGRTAPATASFLARFEKQVHPLGVLEPEIRATMARHARRAYILQLAERSAKARAHARQDDALCPL
jgi:hypothetical protein